MEEIERLLRDINQLWEEDRLHIRKSLEGDLLTAYEKYMEEEKILLDRVEKEVSL